MPDMLSGGEQQMLTICRSLLGNPRVMLIDEPTEGLAPKIVEVVAEVICDICRQGGSRPSRRAEAHHRHARCAARLRDGPRADRVWRNARDAAQFPRGAAGMARGRLVGRRWSQ